MNEKYMVTVYQKIELNDNVMIFKKVQSLTDVYIDPSKDEDEIVVYDSQQKRIVLESMNSDYVMISDDQFCYGYPISLSDLKKLYPECNNMEELYEAYDNEISQVVTIGLYDEETDTVKIVFTNEEMIKLQGQDDVFTNFKITYESEEGNLLSFKINDIKQLINLAQNSDLEEVKNKLLKLNENLNIVNDAIKEQIGEELDFEESEEDEEEIEKDYTVALEKLNRLTGLTNVKEEIYRLVKFLLFKEKAKNKLNLISPNLHMFFTGNPGTGKTTVARIIAELLYSMGYVESNKFVETTPKDLIAGYVGQTAIKAAEFIEKNKGGVIFIDEAYAFAGEAQEFAQEALAEVLKALEKNDTVFIFAGYKDEMQHFMDLNPGLTSRIGYYLDFKDYNKDELYDIFEHKIEDMGFVITDALKNKVLDNLSSISGEKHFGNGRYIDKLINKIILEHAINTEKYKRKDKLITLTDTDFTDEVSKQLVYKKNKGTLGF